MSPVIARLVFFIVIIINCCYLTNAEVKQVLIGVDNVRPYQDDDYICQTHRLADPAAYVTGFTPVLNQSRVHHVIIYACSNANQGIQRNCQSPCLFDHRQPNGGARILYAWANQAPELQLPNGICLFIIFKLLKFSFKKISKRCRFPCGFADWLGKYCRSSSLQG